MYYKLCVAGVFPYIIHIFTGVEMAFKNQVDASDEQKSPGE
jgi:hypothetical protein